MATRKQAIKLYRLWKIYQQKKTAGLSLVELLITIVIAGIAVTAALSAMVELLQTDQRDIARTRTQQEIQMALDYIAEDLRESVYIYESFERDPNSTTDDLNLFLPDFGANVTPVIAFWKAEPIGDDEIDDLPENCSDFDDDKEAECEALKFRRRAYSLVVYLQSTSSNNNWKGKSRIVRYELPKYSNLANLTHSVGFVDPVDNNNFITWPLRDGTNLQENAGGRPTTSGVNPQVLVDFVDNPTSNADPNLPSCPANYSRLPNDATNFNSFFACVRNTGNSLGVNQDIVLYVRGNAEGRGGISSEGFLPTLQTQITLRGVIDKFN